MTIAFKSQVYYHTPHPGLITARPVVQRNHLDRKPPDKDDEQIKKTEHIAESIIHEWMENKVLYINESAKGYTDISKALGQQ